MDIKQVKELADLLDEYKLTSLEVVDSKQTVKLQRKPAPIAAAGFAPQAAALPAAPEHQPDTAAPVVDGHVITSPLVGIFHHVEGASFAEGSAVKTGDVLCVVEAMKLMNEIRSDQNGTIAAVLVSDGDMVEYGQPLFRIK